MQYVNTYICIYIYVSLSYTTSFISVFFLFLFLFFLSIADHSDLTQFVDLWSLVYTGWRTKTFISK